MRTQQQIKTSVELITPSKAKQYVATITSPGQQRKHLDSISDKYARAMKAGHWLLTHQGIAFDTDGVLIDGQHRMYGVIKSDTPQRMMVTRNVPKSCDISMNGCHFELQSIDCFDNGKPRTVGQQLALRHGQKNGTFVAAICRAIAVSATKDRLIPNSVPIALLVCDIFGNGIDYVVENCLRVTGFRSGPLNAMLALYIEAHPEKGRAFHGQVVSGENLKKSDPAYTLRDYLLKGKAYSTKLGSTSELGIIISRAAALCAMHHFNGGQVSVVKNGEAGIDWLLAANKLKIARLRKSLVGEK